MFLLAICKFYKISYVWMCNLITVISVVFLLTIPIAASDVWYIINKTFSKFGLHKMTIYGWEKYIYNHCLVN